MKADKDKKEGGLCSVRVEAPDRDDPFPAGRYELTLELVAGEGRRSAECYFRVLACFSCFLAFLCFGVSLGLLLLLLFT